MFTDNYKLKSYSTKPSKIKDKLLFYGSVNHSSFEQRTPKQRESCMSLYSSKWHKNWQQLHWSCSTCVGIKSHSLLLMHACLRWDEKYDLYFNFKQGDRLLSWNLTELLMRKPCYSHFVTFLPKRHHPGKLRPYTLSN